jgi:tetratricopeptide (TPR) repeat protein
MARKAGILIVTAALFCSFSITGKALMYQRDYSDPEYWLGIIEEWRKAVEQHRPGEADFAAVQVGSWPTFELEFSIALFKNLIKRPLYELAVPPVGCRSLGNYLGIKKEEDKNYWLKRGALLHADIALLQLERGSADPRYGRDFPIKQLIERSKKGHAKNCWSIRLLSVATLDLKDKGNRGAAWIQDGMPDYANAGRHMEFGRSLLDSVTPEPSQDAMVRGWYVATAAYGLSTGRPPYIERHIADAVRQFPYDALILFYAGMLHETYAAPRYQNAPRLPGIKYSHGLKTTELELARNFFQRAVNADPSFAEARLRFGHVSGLLGNHDQAASELQTAAAAIADPQVQYYAALFLGNELAALRRTADARKQFERAAALYPAAQSPLLALSELAHTNGDMNSAAIGIERAFSVAANGSQRNDPRWKYDLVPEHKAAAFLMEMRKAFGDLSR